MNTVFGPIVSINDNYRMIGLLFAGTIMLILFYSVIGYVFGQSDFYLEANVVSNAIGVNPLKITKLEFHGPADKAICPSGQCQIDSVDQYTFLGLPTPDIMAISYNIKFELKDDITNANLGPKKKEFLEQYSAAMFGCMVKDIIETNGQELYYCEDGLSSISRSFDSKIWRFNTNASYDAKANILRVNGNYTGSVS